jgi:hypothetical protein
MAATECPRCDGERIAMCSCQDEPDENDTTVCGRCNGRGLATCWTCK